MQIGDYFVEVYSVFGSLVYFAFIVFVIYIFIYLPICLVKALIGWLNRN